MGEGLKMNRKNKFTVAMILFVVALLFFVAGSSAFALIETTYSRALGIIFLVASLVGWGLWLTDKSDSGKAAT